MCSAEKSTTPLDAGLVCSNPGALGSIATKTGCLGCDAKIGCPGCDAAGCLLTAEPLAEGAAE